MIKIEFEADRGEKRTIKYTLENFFSSISLIKKWVADGSIAKVEKQVKDLTIDDFESLDLVIVVLPGGQIDRIETEDGHSYYDDDFVDITQMLLEN